MMYISSSSFVDRYHSHYHCHHSMHHRFVQNKCRMVQLYHSIPSFQCLYYSRINEQLVEVLPIPREPPNDARFTFAPHTPFLLHHRRFRFRRPSCRPHRLFNPFHLHLFRFVRHFPVVVRFTLPQVPLKNFDHSIKGGVKSIKSIKSIDGQKSTSTNKTIICQ